MRSTIDQVIFKCDYCGFQKTYDNSKLLKYGNTPSEFLELVLPELEANGSLSSVTPRREVCLECALKIANSIEILKNEDEES